MRTKGSHAMKGNAYSGPSPEQRNKSHTFFELLPNAKTLRSSHNTSIASRA
jgi:hypothetical protein